MGYQDDSRLGFQIESNTPNGCMDVTQKWNLFTMDNFPGWDIEDRDYSYYGFLILPVGKFGAPLGLKIARHYPSSDISDPDTVNRIPMKKMKNF